jgi:hypothetical protein
MGGIVGLFMYVEILEIPMVYDDASGIHVSVRNTGTVFWAISGIFVDGFLANL